jgi:hypothetical protein
VLLRRIGGLLRPDLRQSLVPEGGDLGLCRLQLISRLAGTGGGVRP